MWEIEVAGKGSLFYHLIFRCLLMWLPFLKILKTLIELVFTYNNVFVPPSP